MKSIAFLCRNILLGSSFLLSITACSILPEAERVQTYVLTPAATTAVGAIAPDTGQTLRISRPQTGPALDNTRIAVLPGSQQLNNYQGARWASPAPSLLHDYLLEFFRGDSRFPALSSDDQYVQSDFELNSTLLAFQTEYIDGRPEVVIRLDAQLIDLNRQRIVASKRFIVQQLPETPRIPSVIQAFDKATASLAQQLADWIASQPSATSSAP